MRGLSARSVAVRSASTCDRSQDDQRLLPVQYRFGKRCVRRTVGPVFPTCEEAEKRTPLERDMVPDRAAQHGETEFKGIEDGGDGDGSGNFEDQVVSTVRESGQPAQMEREIDADAVRGVDGLRCADGRHGNVWTSTESTGGRSWVMAFHVSPLSEEQYTWPPVVPK